MRTNSPFISRLHTSRHQNAQSLLPFGTWAKINKSWASIKTGWDMMCHTHTLKSLKFINCPSLSLLMALMGSANPLLHRKEKVFGPRVNLEQSSATKAVFRETWPLIHILAWHKRFISRYHVCVCVCPFVCWQVSPLSKFKTLQSEAGDHRIRECVNVWGNLCPSFSIKVKLHFFDLCCKMSNIIQLPGSM